MTTIRAEQWIGVAPEAVVHLCLATSLPASGSRHCHSRPAQTEATAVSAAAAGLRTAQMSAEKRPTSGSLNCVNGKRSKLSHTSYDSRHNYNTTGRMNKTKGLFYE